MYRREALLALMGAMGQQTLAPTSRLAIQLEPADWIFNLSALRNLVVRHGQEEITISADELWDALKGEGP